MSGPLESWYGMILCTVILYFAIGSLVDVALSMGDKKESMYYGTHSIIRTTFWPYFFLAIIYKIFIGSAIEYYSGSEIKIELLLEAIKENGMCADSGYVQISRDLKIATIGDQKFKLSQSDLDKIQKFLSKSLVEDKIKKSTQLLNEFILKKNLEKLQQLEEFGK